MSIPEDFFVNLAASLTIELLRAGAARLRRAALGTPQQQALKRAYQAAFDAALRASASSMDEEGAQRVADLLRQFLDLPGVTDSLLDMALVGALVPDLATLHDRFAGLDTDRDALAIDIDRMLTIFHGRLTTALLDEAGSADGPLYNQVSLGRLLAMQGLLRGQQHSLHEISQLLQRLEAQGGVYNIIIEQATGVAIGDGATVNQFPDEVRTTLAEVLAAVQELNAARRPPAFSQEDLRRYLENVVEQCQTLDLRGAGGPVDQLPLERVYAALKADASNAAERRANHQQFLADLTAHEKELAARPELDDHALWQIKRSIARGLDPMGLTLALRQRASAERGDYLALAARRVDLGELIGQERWAVLLGDPGAGKTTLIRWLAMQFARAMLAGEDTVRAPADQVRVDAAEQTAQEWIDLGPARLPAPLRLADYAAARWHEGHDTALTLFEYLGSQPWLGRPLHPDPAVGQAIVQDAIRQGRALILLDGLDEITNQHDRGQVVDAIAHFLRTWVRAPRSGLCAAEPGFAPWQQRAEEQPQAQGGNQVLITSRPIGYYLAPLPFTLAHYTVEEMSEPAIIRFCQAWTAAVHEKTAREGDPAADAEALRQAVLDPGRPALREIAANPLLLTILAGLFYTLAGKLPERRVELYDQVIKAFTRQRHDAWQTQGLSDERFRYAMGYVAAQLHASPDPRFANGLVGEMDVKAWLRQALRAFDGTATPAQREQAGLLFASAADLGGFLLERGDGAYGFIHRTFQEYFVALYLAFDPDQVAGEVCQRLDDPAWREPLVLAVAQTAWQDWEALPGLLKAVLAAPEPAPGVLPRNALFLAACLPEIRRQPPVEVVAEAVGQLIAAYADRGWLAGETTRPPQALRDAIEHALRPLGGQAGAQQTMTTALAGADPARRLAAAELILATGWRVRALVAPLLAAARDQAEPVATIREALWRHVQDDPGALVGQALPLRRLLAGRPAAEGLAQRPAWLAKHNALYLRPDWRADQPLAPDAVCFDSPLSPWLLQAWQEGWTEERLLDRLAALAGQDADTSTARDAAWAVAVADDSRWRKLLAVSGDGTTLSRPIAGLAWCDRDLALARDLVGDLAHVRDLDGDLARALDLDLARALDLVLARDRDLDLARARDLDLARDRDLDLARARDRALARVTSRDSLDAIEGIIDSARKKLAGRAEALDVPAALDSATTSLVALRAVLSFPTWRALDSARDILKPLRPTANQGADRIAWSADHMHDATTLSPDLLAHLWVPKQPGGKAQKSGPDMRQQLHDLAQSWLRPDDSLRRSYAGLLLAEIGEISAASLLALLPLLVDADDLLRQRARVALQQTRSARLYGQEALLALAGQRPAGRETLPAGADDADDGAWLVSTYCSWTLHQVVHDCPDWLAAWAIELDAAPSDPVTTLLSHIHRLDNSCWPVLFRLLHTSGPRTQEALLDSASWLLREDQVPEDQIEALADTLLELAQSGPEKVAWAAVFALGCFRRPPAAVAAALMGAAQQGSMADALSALARLAPHLDAAGQAEVDRLVMVAPAAPEVAGALARRLVNRQEKLDAQALLAELAARRPDAAAQLRALLAAGADDDVWNDDYHEPIAVTLRLLLEQHDALWPLLVEELRSALAAGSWTRHRMALAALARCAEAMPTQFNNSAADLEPLLLRATRDVDSFSARRFAITALSYLRVITPAVLTVLLRLAGDTEVVQKDALAAAARFNRLDRSLGEALPAELTAALTGPSVLRARTATRLVAALGTSQAAQSTPGLRRQIVQALAAALQDPGSRRPVWKSTEETDGTLDQDLYQALLRVAGFLARQ